jgi:hypothetical protein
MVKLRKECDSFNLGCAAGTSISKKLEEMAPLLWSADFGALIQQEADSLARMGIMAASAELGLSATRARSIFTQWTGSA